MTDDVFRPVADELVRRNRNSAASFAHGDLPAAPALRVAVVACMDARMDIHEILGLENGEAHIMRNAGGVLTDDVIRSLCLSQRALSTREIVLVHHTKCGVATVTEEQFRADLEADYGVAPGWKVGAFSDPYEDVRAMVAELEASPFVPFTDHVRGFVYDVDTGLLDEVD